MTGLLSEFSRGAGSARTEPSSRLTAGLATAALYSLLGLIAWLGHQHVPTSEAESEIVATLLRNVPERRANDPVPPVPQELIRPRAEQPAPPVFTIASGAPPQAPAPLPASAAPSSPLVGGTSGNGPMGQAASGNGTGGNGAASAGCLDPVWVRAVTERVRQFFYYPDAALAVRTTGVAMVHFTVRRNGQIERLQISKSSGDAGLDKAAIDILKKAQPLPAIPDRMLAARIEGDLPINFGVRSFSGKPNTGDC